MRLDYIKRINNRLDSIKREREKAEKEKRAHDKVDDTDTKDDGKGKNSMPESPAIRVDEELQIKTERKKNNETPSDIKDDKNNPPRQNEDNG